MLSYERLVRIDLPTGGAITAIIDAADVVVRNRLDRGGSVLGGVRVQLKSHNNGLRVIELPRPDIDGRSEFSIPDNLLLEGSDLTEGEFTDETSETSIDRGEELISHSIALAHNQGFLRKL